MDDVIKVSNSSLREADGYCETGQREYIMKKQIALVDCNNFFVGCEQLMNPDLKGKAVCVLGSNDGCVLARSNEAKKLGVVMGMPYFMAKREFSEVIYLSCNMSFYLDISNRVMELLYNYTPTMEVYSVDEAFLDLTGIDKIFNLSYEELLLKIKKDIKDKVGVDVSVGLANSKILAKIATNKAKKGVGVHRIKYENIKNELKSVAVEEIWGVGRNTASALKRYGIFTAFDVLLKSDDFYKSTLGKRGLELKHELLGDSVLPVISRYEPPKSLQKTCSFSSFTSDKAYIRNSLHVHLHNMCAKLRRLNLTANVICVMLRTKEFRVFVEKSVLLKPTNSECILNEEVDKLLDKIYDSKIVYRSSGIFVENLESSGVNQLFLFDSEKEKKAKDISVLWDKIENKYGKGIFAIGVSSLRKHY